MWQPKHLEKKMNFLEIILALAEQLLFVLTLTRSKFGALIKEFGEGGPS